MEPLYIIVLAAGNSTRLKSETTKVLHPILGRPMIGLLLETLRTLKPKKIALVLGHQKEAVQAYLGMTPDLVFAHQSQRFGTGHAALVGLKALKHQAKVKRGKVLIVNGDGPLLTKKTLTRLLKSRAPLSLLSTKLKDPFGYGRLLRGTKKEVFGIVEEKNATLEQKKIKEINGGVYGVDWNFLEVALKKIPKNPLKGEYYLTDLVHLAVKAKLLVEAFCLENSEELLGANTREDLALLQKVFLKRLIKEHLAKGVGMEDPEQVYLEPGVKVGPDTYLESGVRLSGQTQIGAHCYLEAGSVIQDCRLSDGVRIKAYSYLEASKVDSGSVIGPFAHLRPDNVVGKHCKVGNFVELKKTKLSDGVKAGHLTYLGDSEVGKEVNIGAGTITCNYDGKRKHKTVIGEGVFIGSDTQLVAPVKVGARAYVGAGTTVTEDVPAGALAISRVVQKNLMKAPQNKDTIKKSQDNKSQGELF
ncbi:MAG: bifunctional UDP-N-acetylglucosamine diphosphorylase/glucosamine-1-phosphate N-acetyltransferase GlmU [Deltaproteobacteria bacterium]|nr:bifunctional UDP-N-acetylglucosamine diphosphorylase/glucosamine-1-phosphate N-acetyltransferase GlmU [Deltaproteobacteria bacterium]